jgi:hypothetical protein
MVAATQRAIMVVLLGLAACPSPAHAQSATVGAIDQGPNYIGAALIGAVPLLLTVPAVSVLATDRLAGKPLAEGNTAAAATALAGGVLMFAPAIYEAIQVSSSLAGDQPGHAAIHGILAASCAALGGVSLWLGASVYEARREAARAAASAVGPARLQIAPIVSPDRQGVAVAVVGW